MPIAYAALATALNPNASGSMQLLPAGLFRARDGRPAGLPGWRIDAATARRIIDRAATRATPFVVDYEHQTLNAEHNGQPAPAAGWIEPGKLEWREGEGLFATDVAWTEKARAHIQAGEYKFVSPVFGYDKQTGEIVELQLAAITNNPGIDGMDSIAALATQFFTRPDGQTNQEDTPMKALAVLLGLAEDASEADINAAVVALKAKLDANVTEIATLKTETAALKAKAPDPAKYVPVETVATLQAEVAALTTRINQGELDEVVTAALKSGKLLPALESWARDLGKQDMAALKAYIDKAVPLAGNQTGGKEPGKADGEEMSADALKITQMLGNDPVAVLKTMKGE